MTFTDDSFSIDEGGSLLYSSTLIPIDSTRIYRYSVEAKSTSSSAVQYLGLSFFDIDQKEIKAYHVSEIGNSLTTLTRNLQRGDTEVYVENLDGFVDVNTPVVDGLIFWNYKDSTGYTYPPETYSRNIYRYLMDTASLDRSNHVIHLKTPWDYETISKGTKLSQSSYGASRQYSLLDNKKLSSSFEKLEATISTDQIDLRKKLWAGAKYVKFFAISNYNEDDVSSVPESTTFYKNIILKQIYS